MYGLTVALLALGSCLVVSACDYPSNLPCYGQEVLEAPCSSYPLEVEAPAGLAYPSAVEIEAPACSPLSIGSSYPVENYDCSQSAPIYSAPISSSCGVDSTYPSLYENQAYNTEFVQPAFVQQPSYLEGSVDSGPQPQPEPIKYLDTKVLPLQVSPIQQLPAPQLPPPVVIANKCFCTKVVQKPQLYQRLIVQQKNQRFLKKTYVPRTEKVEYCAKPRC